MAGIYVHIPFCRAKCLYCNFYSIPNRESIDEYTSSVIDELGMRRDYLNGEKIDTIYFGGGTPSIAGTDSIAGIIRAVHEGFDVASDPEITLEANPDDIDSGFLSGLKDTGINRLSIGIQSFRDEDLRYLGRAHDAASAVSAIERSRDAGFSNLTIDLIYGIPGLDDESWKRNIDTATGYGIPHISAYALTVECDTPLERLIEKGKRDAPSEEDGARQFEILMDEMRRREYIHYEISNFCREGYISRHNSSYWKGIPYLGAGASAHSYDGKSRQW
ncbi:MAG TPA: radical SAM family heme chaperone HemW, partial [Spirochaetota bacterium]|nr:radical SAM family heme chaperone HemW [Spirochaetota bacterium]